MSYTEEYYGLTEERYVKRRGEYLTNQYGWEPRKSKSLALNHLGYSASGAARYLGYTEDTVKRWWAEIESEFSVAIFWSAPPPPPPEERLWETVSD